MLAAIYYGAMYGGSTTAILVNIPGEVSSLVTTLDGYQMARQGRAGPALAIAAISSFVAGTLGIIGLTFFAPHLADVALKIGPPEYFGLVILALSVVVSLSGQSLIKGFASAAFGALVALIGIDPRVVQLESPGEGEALNDLVVVILIERRQAPDPVVVLTLWG